MYNFNEYINDKRQLMNKMQEVKLKLSELNDFGIDITESLKKIDSAMDIIQKDKISVVLVGAFSDGKTSVVAGWINEKLDNMKISSDESSDEILCYTPSTIPEGCQIVDTPGLFGDKIGSDEDGSEIALSDKTKKFISEANLILYVVTAKNPIKDSHKECIKWILKDLNKLLYTVFVINRMDDVADLTDEDDFSLQSRIKTENLRGKLLECGLNETEASNAKVVCISAAPNGKGIDVWNSHREEYLKRSHLRSLEKITNSILSNSRENLITKTGCDILNDEITKTLNVINNQEQRIEKVILPEKRESLERNKKDLGKLRERLMKSKRDMKEDLKTLRKKKISTIRAVSMENFRETMEDEIGILEGKEGYILNEEINEIFQDYADMYSGWAIELGHKFQAEYDKQNSAIENLMKKGVVGAANGLKGAGQIGVEAFKGGIFAGRELLGKMGVVIKFKPWQVTKMASFATKALPVIGAGIDVVSNIVENVVTQERNKKFENSKEKIRESIEDTFDEIIKMLDNEEKFIDQFAPQYRMLEEQISQDKKDIDQQDQLTEKYKAWRSEVVEVDYKIL